MTSARPRDGKRSCFNTLKVQVRSSRRLSNINLRQYTKDLDNPGPTGAWANPQIQVARGKAKAEVQVDISARPRDGKRSCFNSLKVHPFISFKRRWFEKYMSTCAPPTARRGQLHVLWQVDRARTAQHRRALRPHHRDVDARVCVQPRDAPAHRPRRAQVHPNYRHRRARAGPVLLPHGRGGRRCKLDPGLKAPPEFIKVRL